MWDIRWHMPSAIIGALLILIVTGVLSPLWLLVIWLMTLGYVIVCGVIKEFETNDANIDPVRDACASQEQSTRGQPS